MEELCQWFPLVAQKILNNADDLALISFKEAGRNNAEFLGKERFYWTRIIKRYNWLIGDLQEVWTKVVGKTSVEIIKELAFAVHQFPLAMSTKCRNVCIALLTPVDFVQKVRLLVLFVVHTVKLYNHIKQSSDDKELWLKSVKIPTYSSSCLEW